MFKTILLSNTNEQAIDIHNDMDKSQKIMLQELKQTKKKRVSAVIPFI